ELAIANYLTGRGDVNAASQASGVATATLQRLSQELSAAAPALVLAGGSGENGLELVAAAAALNQVRSSESVASFEGIARQSDVFASIERMRAGQVSAAFVRGPNPAYNMPSSAKFAEAFAKV